MGMVGDNEKKMEDIDTDLGFTLSDNSDELAGKLRDDDTEYVESTLPLDDLYPFGDQFETQIVDFDGQTQVLDLFGETQLLDECSTGVPVDCDDEELGKTEVLGDTQVLSDDESVKRGSDGLVGIGRRTPYTSLKKEINRDAEPLSDVISNGERGSGSMVRGFTSVRAASVRASGLAARNRALKRMNINSCSTKGDNSLPRENADKDAFQLENRFDQQNNHEDFVHLNESRYKNLQKVGSSTVRKLFTDDEVRHMKEADDGNNGLGGLSYLNSEEPGGLSQPNALEVVDKCLQLIVMEDHLDVVLKDSSGGKEKLVSSAKGMQSLAKKSTTRNSILLSSAYDWDDNLEDEGGGEFFQKKKDLFFSSGHRKQSIKKIKMPGSSKSSSTIEKMREKENPDTKRKVSAEVLSDSRLMSKNLRGNRPSSSQIKASIEKNLIKDEEVINTSEDVKIDNGTDNDVSNILDVGYDTPMAADAMENLRFVGGVNDSDHDNRNEGTQRMRVSSLKKADKGSNMVPSIHGKGSCLFDNRVLTRQSKKARTSDEHWTESRLTSAKKAKNVKKQLGEQLAEKQPIKAKAGPKDYGKKNLRSASKMAEQTGKDRVLVSSGIDNANETRVTSSVDQKPLVECAVQKDNDLPMPIANRTRRSLQLSRVTSGNALINHRENTDARELSIMKRAQAGRLFDKGEICESYSDKARKLRNMHFGHFGQLSKKMLNHPTRRITRSQLSLSGQEANYEGNRKSKRSKTDASSTLVHKGDSKYHSTACGAKRIRTGFSMVEGKSSRSRDDVVKVTGKHSKIKDGSGSKSPTDRNEVVVCLEASPNDRCKPSVSASTTPLGYRTPANAASPVCMGDECHKQPCRKDLVKSSLMKEINSLITASPELTFPVKESRKRRDMISVRVMFSRHLDPDIIKQQKKILAQLGASEASSMSDASHFVTDVFVRTRNMLEAIAFGKPVVTHLWLESCAQASCFIDERNYILRDARKEKEFGFSMPVSLAHACQHPILRGQRVLITPNTKPGKEVLANLVKAVHGLAVERLGRSSLTDKKLPDDVLVLSCEEDYEICLPFLEKGASVYSSELLLNGIVTQRLEYERHRLFAENVKRTRSTTWLKRNNHYVPINKSK